MPVSRRRLENSAKVVSKEKGGRNAVVQHGVSTAQACLMSPSCERNDRKRSKETAGIADWLGIKVDVSLPAMRVLRSLSRIIEWRESLKHAK